MSFPHMKPGIFYCMGRIYCYTILLCFLHCYFCTWTSCPLEYHQNDISHNDTVKITLLVFAIHTLFPVVLNWRLYCTWGLKILQRSLPGDGNYWSDQDFQSWLFFSTSFSSCFFLSSCFLLLAYSSFSPFLAPPCISNMCFVFLHVECPHP